MPIKIDCPDCSNGFVYNLKGYEGIPFICELCDSTGKTTVYTQEEFDELKNIGEGMTFKVLDQQAEINRLKEIISKFTDPNTDQYQAGYGSDLESQKAEIKQAVQEERKRCLGIFQAYDELEYYPWKDLEKHIMGGKE